MPSSVSAYEMNLLIQNRKSFSSIQNLDLQTQFFRPKRAKLQHSVILSGQMTHQQLTPYWLPLSAQQKDHKAYPKTFVMTSALVHTGHKVSKIWAPLSLKFLTYEIRVVIPNSKGHCKDKISNTSESADT